MNTENMIQIIALILGSNWLGQFVVEYYKSKKKKKTPAELILKALSRRDLLAQAERYKKQGYIDSEEYDDVFEEFNAYEALGGNGRVKREYGEGGTLQTLPVK